MRPRQPVAGERATWLTFLISRMSRVTIFNSIEFYSYERFVELFSYVLYIYTHLYVYIYLYFFLRIRLLEMKAFAVDSEIF